MSDGPWSLYLVRRGDGALYCGIARDVALRFAEHRAGGARCAKALRGRGPLRLVWTCELPDQPAALRAERRLKRWSKARKEALVRGELALTPPPVRP